MKPFVTVIVPCRNEERFIASCLDSIVKQDYPKERLEVFVVDGMSEDKTREIIKEFEKNYPFLKLLENPKKITPAALNIGIKRAKGEIIIKMDAHSVYPKDYISKCVKHLEESGADNVGGILKSIPSKNTLFAKSIAICLSHPFGSGRSFFRVGTKFSKTVDTVAFGCYRKSVFEKIGLFDERMAKIEDYEFNLRLRRAGGKIILFPDIVAFYYPSSSNLKDFFWHNFQDGIWITYPWKFIKMPLLIRHYIPLLFVLAFPLSFFPYFLLSFLFSLQIALKEKDIKYLFSMPLTFFCRHFGYGLGSLWGIIKIFK